MIARTRLSFFVQSGQGWTFLATRKPVKRWGLGSFFLCWKGPMACLGTGVAKGALPTDRPSYRTSADPMGAFRQRDRERGINKPTTPKHSNEIDQDHLQS